MVWLMVGWAGIDCLFAEASDKTDRRWVSWQGTLRLGGVNHAYFIKTNSLNHSRLSHTGPKTDKLVAYFRLAKCRAISRHDWRKG